jgi:hypothetical protein
MIEVNISKLESFEDKIKNMMNLELPSLISDSVPDSFWEKDKDHDVWIRDMTINPTAVYGIPLQVKFEYEQYIVIVNIDFEDEFEHGVSFNVDKVYSTDKPISNSIIYDYVYRHHCYSISQDTLRILNDKCWFSFVSNIQILELVSWLVRTSDFFENKQIIIAKDGVEM